MNILPLDYETFFDDEFSLKKLTTEHYVRDARFEPLLLGMQLNGGAKAWIPQPAIARALAQYDWNETAVLCHHAQFDGLILSHHYNVRPKLWLDTLSMARLMLGNHVSVSLANLAAHFGLEGKSVPYNAFAGKRWADIDGSLRDALGRGCLHDVELTWEIFQRLAVGFPAEEYQVIDMTVRMFTEPCLMGDADILAEVWCAERDRKAALLAEYQIDVGALQSAEQFAALLRAEGIEPETKPGKNGPIGAFAKTDSFMISLLEHEDDYIRALAEARLGLKSTLDQTRAERLGYMAMRGRRVG